MCDHGLSGQVQAAPLNHVIDISPSLLHVRPLYALKDLSHIPHLREKPPEVAGHGSNLNDLWSLIFFPKHLRDIPRGTTTYFVST
jgi:hypothetical protein